MCGPCFGATAAIVLLLLLLLAAYAWRRRAREGLTYASPAAPRLREAAGCLYGALQRLGADCRRLEPLAGPDGGDARRAVALTAAAAERAERRLASLPPTYANYLAVYDGLAPWDRTLGGAAAAYARLGRDADQDAARGGAGADRAAALGRAAAALGLQVRRVVAARHRLGAALDLE